mgnify:CR=1 FL=1
MRLLAVLLAALLIPVACPAGGSAGRDKPEPTAAPGWDGTKPTICDIPGVPPPGKVFGPKPGFVHVLVIVVSDTYSRNPTGGRDICTPNVALPFRIDLRGDVDGQPGMKGESGIPLPWKAKLITPHFEHLYIALSSKARRWNVTVSAATTPGQVRFEGGTRIYIRCTIFVDGARASHHTAKLSRGAGSVGCAATGTLA